MDSPSDRPSQSLVPFPAKALLSEADVRRLLTQRLERTPHLSVGRVDSVGRGIIQATVTEPDGRALLTIEVDARSGRVLGCA